MPKPKSLADRLLEEPEARRSPCHTCTKYPELVGEIREAFAVIADGRAGDRAIPTLLRLLKREYGFRIGDTGLRRHLERCEPELFQKWRGAR